MKLLIIGLIVGFIFSYLKGFIFKTAQKRLGLDLFPNTKTSEPFDISKFLNGFFNLKDKVLWTKDWTQLFNARKLVIYGVIIGVIYGYGWYQGKQGQVPRIDLRGKETTIQLNEHFLHVKKDGSMSVEDKEGKILKEIKVKDIPELKRALRPYGFELKPYFSYGIAMGNEKIKQDIGLGLDWLKWYKLRLGNWASNNGIWLGLNYKITDNFSIGGGVGKGWGGSDLTGFRGAFDF